MADEGAFVFDTRMAGYGLRTRRLNVRPTTHVNDGLWPNVRIHCLHRKSPVENIRPVPAAALRRRISTGATGPKAELAAAKFDVTKPQDCEQAERPTFVHALATR
jgi:hypothetical protein